MHHRLFLNFASKWIRNKKLDFKGEKLDDKSGQRLLQQMLNKNFKEEHDGDLGPWKINEKKGRPPSLTRRPQ